MLGNELDIDSSARFNSRYILLSVFSANKTDYGSNNRREWASMALNLIFAEKARGTRTPLVPLALDAFPGIDIYLKDESLHPTGSLKHRLARSLFIDALCNAKIGPETTIYEASSGSTAVSEAYFSRLIGLPFVAVVPRDTATEKLALIEQQGGTYELVNDPTTTVAKARELAFETGGFFMDQFTKASQVTDWRTDNVAEEIYDQMLYERHAIPTWLVIGAGTGGTSTTLGRYARVRQHPTRIVVVDPEGSAFYEGWRRKDRTFTTNTPSRIEGIGRTRVEASFTPELIDEVFPIPDGASIAAMQWYARRTGYKVGASSGTNLWGTLQIAQQMHDKGECGSIVTFICDSGDRYASTYYDRGWLEQNLIDPEPYATLLHKFEVTGQLNAIDSDQRYHV